VRAFWAKDLGNKISAKLDFSFAVKIGAQSSWSLWSFRGQSAGGKKWESILVKQKKKKKKKKKSGASFDRRSREAVSLRRQKRVAKQQERLCAAPEGSQRERERRARKETDHLGPLLAPKIIIGRHYIGTSLGQISFLFEL